MSELLAGLHLDRPPTAETALFRSVPSAAALVRRAGFRDVHAWSDLVEYQWTLGAFVHCAWESEEPELLDSLDDTTRSRLERLWTERLELLTEDELRYRDLVAYVTGKRPA